MGDFSSSPNTHPSVWRDGHEVLVPSVGSVSDTGMGTVRVGVRGSRGGNP